MNFLGQKHQDVTAKLAVQRGHALHDVRCITRHESGVYIPSATMISMQPSGKSSGRINRSGDGGDDLELLEWQAYVAGLLEWIGLIGLGSGTHRYGKQKKVFHQF
jgi:hypothetical protein